MKEKATKTKQYINIYCLLHCYYYKYYQYVLMFKKIQYSKYNMDTTCIFDSYNKYRFNGITMKSKIYPDFDKKFSLNI